MRKAAGVLGLVSMVAAATLVLAVPAGAQSSSYPPQVCILSLAAGQSPVAGGSLVVNGANFDPGSVVPLSINGVFVGDTVASEASTIATTVTIPSNATSPVVLAAPGCSITFQIGGGSVTPVTPLQPLRPRALAFTGSDTSPLVVIGVVAVALGTVLVFGARRRGATKATVEAAKVAS